MFPTDDEVEDLLTHMDQDKSGMVDLTELIKQMASQVIWSRRVEILIMICIVRFKLEKKWILNMILKRHSFYLTRTESKYI